MAFIYATIAALIACVLGAGLLFYGQILDYVQGGGKMARVAKMRKPVEGSPLTGTSLSGEMKKAMEPVLLTWENADSRYLTGRMDTTFREMEENTIRLLQKHGLRRRLRFCDMRMMNTGKPGNFKSWNDGGRQWREGEADGTALEDYIDVQGNIVSSEYFRTAGVSVRQSRHVKCSDLSKEKERKKQGKKGTTSFYEEETAQKCYSCGADITISGKETTCPFCGRPVFANFFDWQTQAFSFERVTMAKTLIDIFPFIVVTFFCTLLMLLPFGSAVAEDIEFALLMTAAGVVVGIIMTFVLVLLWEKFFDAERKLKSVYPNLFRSSILEELWKKEDRDHTLEMWLGEIKYKSVTNTEETSTVVADVKISRRIIDDSGKITSSDEKKRLTMVRARYPQKLKSKGEILENKSCPSCGVPFLPDDHGACTYCGYSLQVDNSKWKIQ